MANRYAFQPRSLTKELFIIPITCTILGNTTPANGTFSIVQGAEALSGALTRVSAGLYRLILRDSFPALMDAQVSIIPHNGAARTVRLRNVNVTDPTLANRVIEFDIVGSALTVVDTPNGETDRVFINLTARNSTVVR